VHSLQVVRFGAACVDVESVLYGDDMSRCVDDLTKTAAERIGAARRTDSTALDEPNMAGFIQ